MSDSMPAAGANDSARLMLYDARKKNVLVAYLLWFFFGWLGAHRFYAGRAGSAVLQIVLLLGGLMLLFSSGIGIAGLALFGLWWLIDAFLIPGMISGSNTSLAARINS